MCPVHIVGHVFERIVVQNMMRQVACRWQLNVEPRRVALRGQKLLGNYERDIGLSSQQCREALFSSLSRGGNGKKKDVHAWVVESPPQWKNRKSPFTVAAPNAAISGSYNSDAEEQTDIRNTERTLNLMKERQTAQLEKTVEWFMSQSGMPNTYFTQVPTETTLDHLTAVYSMHATDYPGSRSVRALDRLVGSEREITFIQTEPETNAAALLSMMDNLPLADGTLTKVKIFVTLDQQLGINVFTYSPSNRPVTVERSEDDVKHIYDLAEKVQMGLSSKSAPNPLFERNELKKYFARCDGDYLKNSHASRFLSQRLLFDKVSGTEGVAVNIETYDGRDKDALLPLDEGGAGTKWITVALSNVFPKIGLTQILRLLQLHNMSIRRCHMDTIDDGENGIVTMLRILTIPPSNESERWAEEGAWEPIEQAIPRLKWLDEQVFHLGLGLEDKPFTLAEAEIVNALLSLSYPILHKKNPWAYTKSQMASWLETGRYARHAKSIAQLFSLRFSPDENVRLPPGAEFDSNADAITTNILRDVELEELQVFLTTMVDAVRGTLRSNVHLPQRYALSMRLDPRVLMSDEELKTKETPYGLFFVHGRRFNTFHVRFRDIARGGMRIVSPRTPEQLSSEGWRHFDEAYSLAYAQQLKNKDIPEGGSKGVILVDTSGSSPQGSLFAMRKGVKATTDALLDLIVKTDYTKDVVDYWGKPEMLYLGPDEQVIPEDITWIIDRAAKRGHPVPMSFMSSKPESGINHKEYGVTSVGVFEMLDIALGQSGIFVREKQDKFSIKITGGPNGDVAGNMMKILVDEYGDCVSFVGIADGTGSAEDPNGLSHDELLRLVHENLPISEYNTSLLSSNGKLHTVDTEEGIIARNTMHNRVVSDVFVPGGGRPNTVNKNNWNDFLVEDGVASSPLVVEGANLFFSPEVRKMLYDAAGVKIIKDSSANKCGVICSSFEIASSMLLSEDEFIQHKGAIVADVLDRLRHSARREAQLLFKEQKLRPKPHPTVSEAISKAINRVTDAVNATLLSKPESEFRRLQLQTVVNSLPATISQLAGSRIGLMLSPEYLRCAFASAIASDLVYSEGVAFVDAQVQEDRLGELALQYAEEKNEIVKLAEKVKLGGPIEDNDRDTISNLLFAGGVRARMGVY